MSKEVICTGAFTAFNILSSDKHRTCCKHTSGVITNNYKEDYNSPEMQKMKQGLLGKGELSRDCKSCIQNNDIVYHWFGNDDFKSTIDDTHNPDEFNPLHVEIASSNRCNLSCLSCSSDYSNLVSKMHYELGYIDAPVTMDSTFNVEEFINDTKSLKAATFVGGEPILNPRFEEIIESVRNSNIEKFHIFTNAMPNKHKGKYVYEYLTGLKQVTVTCSIDGIGEVTEHLRANSKFDKQVKMIDRISKSDNVDYLLINFCVSNLSLLRVSEFIEYYHSNWRNLGIKLTYSTPSLEHIMSPSALPAELKTDTLLKMNQIRHKYKDCQDIQEFIHSILRTVFYRNVNASESFNKLMDYLRNTDKLLNQDTLSVFPILKDYYET